MNMSNVLYRLHSGCGVYFIAPINQSRSAHPTQDGTMLNVDKSSSEHLLREHLATDLVEYVKMSNILYRLYSGWGVDFIESVIKIHSYFL